MRELNLFRLHDSNDPIGGWILAYGKNLHIIVESILNQLYTKYKRHELDELFVSRLGVSNITSQRFRRKGRKSYPLVFLDELMGVWKDTFNKSNNEVFAKKEETIENIEFLRVNRPNSISIKAVKRLNETLCKIAGAHAADGTLYGSLIRITDEDKQAVEAFKIWVEEVFKVKLTDVVPVKNSSEWGLYFQIKIISRYLRKFFDFPSGTKTYSVTEPRIIRNSNVEFRKAFAVGILTFEAGIGIKPQIEFCVSSKKLRDSVCEILNKHNIKIKFMKRKSSGYWRFWTGILTKNEATKWLEFFEPQTEKWYKLRDIIYGYRGKIASIIDVFYVFNKIYPLRSSSKVSLSDVFQITLEQKEVYRYQLVNLLKEVNSLNSFGGKWAHSVSHYLNILKSANIISVENRKFGSKKSFGSIVRQVYRFNSDLSTWKVPFRPSLENEVKYLK